MKVEVKRPDGKKGTYIYERRAGGSFLSIDKIGNERIYHWSKPVKSQEDYDKLKKEAEDFILNFKLK